MNRIGRLVVGAAVTAAAIGATRPAPAAAQGPAQPPARFLVWGTGGVSLRQDPLQTHFGDVYNATIRAGVPIGRFVPFVSGSVARAKTPCPAGASCSNSETRFLGGLAYVPGGGGPGPYLGAGLGLRDYRGSQDLAHSVFVGLTIPGTRYFAPTFELRSEGYGSLNELLIIAAGVRFSVPRPLPPEPPGS